MNQRIAAGEFKAKCLSLLDDVAKTRKEIVITKRGRPVAKVVPIPEEKPKPTFGRMKGSGIILGDIISPIDVKWDAVEGKWNPDED
jgi:prevent-host-death family protein